MATEVVSTIRSSGGDYTSLSAWEAGEQGDLVSADEIRTAECYDEWPSGLSDAVTVDGSTTDSTRYMKITVAAGHRHNGTPGSGFFITSWQDWTSVVKLEDDYCCAEWLDIRNTSTGNDGRALRLGAANTVASKCLITGASSYAILVLGYDSARLETSLVYGGTSGLQRSDYIGGKVYNCVFAGQSSYSIGGSSESGRGFDVRNCVLYKPPYVTSPYIYFNSASTHNATSSASDDAPGGNSVTGIDSGDFVNAASNDFHLASGSALIGAGTNLYSTFTTDIDGDTWPSSGAWDIGFDYYSAGGGGATITPTGLSSSAFGSFSVLAGDRTITFTGKASDEAFGSFSLRAKRLVSFTGKSSDEAFGAFSVHPGSVSILLNSKTTDEAYGTHSLLSGQKVISPTAKGSDSAFGSFIIVSGDRILLINGIASNEAFGAFSVNNNTANQTIIPSGYFDSSIGSFSLRPDQYIIFSGKEYLEFGQFLLSGSAVVRAMHFFDWIAQQPGLRGTLNDKLYQYLIAQGFTGSTPTMMFLWLRSLGYTGNTASMLTAFERDYTTRWY